MYSSILVVFFMLTIVKYYLVIVLLSIYCNFNKNWIKLFFVLLYIS